MTPSSEGADSASKLDFVQPCSERWQARPLGLRPEALAFVQPCSERWQARPLGLRPEALALGPARRARCIARVLGHQTLLKRLMCRRGRTRQERQGKRTESDFDRHWTRDL